MTGKTGRLAAAILLGIFLCGAVRGLCEPGPAAGRRRRGSAREPCGCIGTHFEVRVNGRLIHGAALGEGKPVILLHGNGGSHADLESELKELSSAGYRVYAPDSRGQGANRPEEELHYADMAEDVWALMRALGISRAAVYGWSDGGIVALLLALAHPEAAELLAVSGANLSPDGIPELAAECRADLEKRWDPLDALVAREPDIAPEALSAITVPVLVTAGGRDVVLPEHTWLIAESLPRAKLVILEGEDHDSYIYESDVMGNLLLEFFQENGY